MRRNTWITFYLSEDEKELIRKTALKSGIRMADFVRNSMLDLCNNRLIRIENLNQLPQFERASSLNTELIENVNKLQEMVRNVNNLYEIDRDENLDAIAKLDITIESALSDKIVEILNEGPLFLDQIAERLHLSSKTVLKALADLRKIQLVDQDIRMRWFRI